MFPMTGSLIINFAGMNLYCCLDEYPLKSSSVLKFSISWLYRG